MNPYVMEVTCSVCGGPGCARPRDAAAEWFGGVQHRDPAVCAMYLKERERKVAAKEKEIEEATDGIFPAPI